VTLAETMAIEETGDALRALSDQQLLVDQIIVNRLTPPPRGPCAWCRGRRSIEQDAIRRLRPHLRSDRIQVTRIPAAAVEPRGTAALRGLARHLARKVPREDLSARVVRPSLLTAPVPATTPLSVSAVVPHAVELVLFGGKGGVGKTTCAAAAAIDAALAGRDRQVLLISVDPAHSLGDVLGQTFSDDPRRIRGGPANLTVRELDAARGFAALRERFAEGIEDLLLRTGAAGAGSAISGPDRQVLADLLDLAPPGVDELVAIIEVLDTLADGRGSPRDLIVLDTAPTGHALRLLEMPALVHDWVKALMAILLKYQPVIGVGDLGAVLLRLSQGLGRLRALLRDSTRTRFIAVTRAAALPRAETVRLLARLRAAGIGVPMAIVNAAGAGSCARCRADRARQEQEVAALARDIRPKRREPLAFVLAPSTVPPPSGWRELHAFFGHWRVLPRPARQ
jgi:arsenite-transporting ATPase